MSATAKIARLCVYPIKSLDGVEVKERTLYPTGGGLWGDRMWAIFDERGEAVTGKTEPRVFRLRPKFKAELNGVELSFDEKVQEFSIGSDDNRALNHFLSDVLQQPVTLRQELQSGFPDYTSNPGPSIVSTATLNEVCAWYPGLTLAEARRRFRMSIEIDGVPAFWEDCLFAAKGVPRPFMLGHLKIHGMGPIMRCPVPTRNPDSGEIQRGFQRQFIKNRQPTILDREGVAVERLAELYYLGVKTQVPSPNGALKIGDELKLL